MKSYQVINLKKYLINQSLLGGSTFDNPNHLIIPEGTAILTGNMVRNS